MRITQIHIDDFGKFHQFDLYPSEGLNILHGENESGKTTLLMFLRMMLYGHAGAARSIEGNPRKRYKPWNGKDMKGFLRFTNQGISYRLERTFGSGNRSDQIALWDEEAGIPVSLPARSEPGRWLFGIGEEAFERTAFIGESGRFEAPKKEDQLMQRLQNLVTTGDEGTSFKDADTRLEEWERTLEAPRGTKGLLDIRRNRLDSLRKEEREAEADERRKEEIAERLEALKAEWAQAERKKAEWEAALQQASRAKEKQRLESDAKAYNAWKADCDAARVLEQQWETEGGRPAEDFPEQADRLWSAYHTAVLGAKQAEESLANAEKDIADVSVPSAPTREELDRARADEQRIRRLNERERWLQQHAAFRDSLNKLNALEKESAAAQNSESNRVRECEKMGDDVRSAKQALEKANAERSDALAAQRVASSQLENAKADRMAKEQERSASEERLESMRQEAHEPERWIRQRSLWWLLAVVTLIGFAALGLRVHPWLYAGAALSAVWMGLAVRLNARIREEQAAKARIGPLEAETAQKRERAEEAERALQAARAEADETERLFGEAENRRAEAEKYLRAREEAHEQAREARDAVRNEKQQLSAEVRALTAQVEKERATVEEIPHEPTDPEALRADREIAQRSLDAVMERYGCHSVQELADAFSRAESARGHAEAQAANRRKATETAELWQSRAEEAERALLAFVRAWSEPQSVEDAKSAIDRRVESLREYAQLADRIARAEETLGDRIHRDPTERLAALQEAERANEGEASSAAEVDETRLRADLEATDARTAALREEIASETAAVREQFRHKKPLSRILVEIEETEAEIRRLEEERESLAMARRALKGAFEEIRRDFSPQLNAETAEIFGKITQGKYEQLKVNQEYGIVFEDDATRRLYEWEYLSAGTVEQVYLSLRLAIARLIEKKDAMLPFFLDDSFAEYDDDRMRAALEFLKQYGREGVRQRQILLTTCHDRIRAWAEDNEEVTLLPLP